MKQWYDSSDIRHYWDSGGTPVYINSVMTVVTSDMWLRQWWYTSVHKQWYDSSDIRHYWDSGGTPVHINSDMTVVTSDITETVVVHQCT